MGTPNDPRPLTTFRGSKWRYSQFVVLGAIVALLVKWLTSLGWVPAGVIGAVVGVGYYLFERKRGVI